MSPANKTLSLIADLLARAEGGTTQAERDLALRRAQREATRHGIDLAVAAHLQAQRGVPMQPEERRIQITSMSGRKLPPGVKIYTDLFLGIAVANDIRTLLSRNGATVWAHGMPSDIDMAETLYASLVVQMDTAASEWLATGEYLGDFDPDNRRMVWSDHAWAMVPERAPSKGVARREFQRGFVRRISGLLLAAKLDAEAEAEKAQDQAREAGTGTDNHLALTPTAIALREKTKAVQEFHEEVIRKKNIRSTYGGDSGGRSFNFQARNAGRTAAERADVTGRRSRAIGA